MNLITDWTISYCYLKNLFLLITEANPRTPSMCSLYYTDCLCFRLMYKVMFGSYTSNLHSKFILPTLTIGYPNPLLLIIHFLPSNLSSALGAAQYASAPSSSTQTPTITSHHSQSTHQTETTLSSLTPPLECGLSFH